MLTPNGRKLYNAASRGDAGAAKEAIDRAEAAASDKETAMRIYEPRRSVLAEKNTHDYKRHVTPTRISLEASGRAIGVNRYETSAAISRPMARLRMTK